MKRVSIDEKKRRLLSLFEARAVYQQNDIEKLGKELGIVVQSIKQVLQSLVDDGLVTLGKIGSTNYYWSFAELGSVKERHLRTLKDQIGNLQRQKAKLESDIKSIIPIDTTELSEIETRNIELKSIKDYNKAEKIAQAAIDRWNENMDLLQDYCFKLGMSNADFRQCFDN